MCFGGRDDGGEAKRSKEIDAVLHRDEKAMSRQVKLLLLGMSMVQFSSFVGSSSRATTQFCSGECAVICHISVMTNAPDGLPFLALQYILP